MRKLKSVIRFVSDFFYFAIFGGIKHARRKGVKIGEGCRIYIRSWGTEPFLVSVGNNVTITSGVRFITHDGSTCLIKSEAGFRYQKYGEINIGDNVFIGVNTLIMPGVNIGDNVIVAAGSVVTKDLEQGFVYGGVPAKTITSFDDYESKVKAYCENDSVLLSISDYEEKVRFALNVQKNKK